MRFRIRIFGLVLALATTGIRGVAQPSAAAVSAFNSYVGRIEARLEQQHQSSGSILAQATVTSAQEAELHRGEFVIERLAPAQPAVSGVMLYDWRGTAFIPGATATEFENLMKDFDDYPRRFSPEVVRAKVVGRAGDHMQVVMRVRQKHVLTVVMDTAYDVMFHRIDARRGYSISRSTRISEIGDPGTPSEHALSPGEEHGFLWRLNTYWTYEERDGGLYAQIESVSLTRSIPTGMGWAVRPFVESVPRESLEFTLRSTCRALEEERKGR